MDAQNDFLSVADDGSINDDHVESMYFNVASHNFDSITISNVHTYLNILFPFAPISSDDVEKAFLCIEDAIKLAMQLGALTVFPITTDRVTAEVNRVIDEQSASIEIDMRKNPIYAAYIKHSRIEEERLAFVVSNGIHGTILLSIVKAIKDVADQCNNVLFNFSDGLVH